MTTNLSIAGTNKTECHEIVRHTRKKKNRTAICKLNDRFQKLTVCPTLTVLSASLLRKILQILPLQDNLHFGNLNRGLRAIPKHNTLSDGDSLLHAVERHQWTRETVPASFKQLVPAVIGFKNGFHACKLHSDQMAFL